MASKNKESFAKCIERLSQTCSNNKKTEILVKIDVESDIQFYQDVLASSFKHQKVIYTPITGYMNIGDFHNDLCAQSSGNIIWVMTDDFFVAHGDWFSLITNTRDIYSDNIYSIYIDFGNGKTFSLAPAVSREWFQCLGYITYGWQADYWIAMIARGLNRYIQIPKDQLLMNHVRTKPHVDKKAVKKLHVLFREREPIALGQLRQCMGG